MQDHEHTKLEFVSRELDSKPVRRRPDSRRPDPIMPFTRHTTAARSSRQGTRQKNSPFAIKAGICILVAICCLLMRFLPWQWVLDTRQTMSNLFTYDLEFDESLGRLKFVQTLFPGVAEVFNAKSTMQYPVEGILQSAYRADGQDHVVFKSEAGASVKAAADGRVVKRGTHDKYGNYLMIEHAGNMVTIYYGLKSSVLEKGAEVKGGDVIGTLTDSGELIFELRISDKAQNPMRYIGTL